MKMLSLICICILFSCSLPEQDGSNLSQEGTFQLSQPQINIDSIFFKKSATINASLAIDDVFLHYTLDGKTPTDEADKLQNELQVTQSAIFKLKAFHTNFLESETKEIQLVKMNSMLANALISSSEKASDAYPGNGLNSLQDFKKGSLNFRQNANWLGYQKDSISYHIALDKAELLQSCTLSFLHDPASWIFSPEKIAIKIGSQTIGTWADTHILNSDSAQLLFANIDLSPASYEDFEIIIYNMTSIPAWHPGKGSKPWLFIDEIIVN